MLSDGILSLYFDAFIVENNLYHQAFPALYDIPQIDLVLEYFQQEENDELDPAEEPALTLFLQYYGDLQVADG